MPDWTPTFGVKSLATRRRMRMTVTLGTRCQRLRPSLRGCHRCLIEYDAAKNGRDAPCEQPSLCPRGHTFYRGAHDFHVFCFAQRDHAEKFLTQFGGEMIDPKDQPRWPRGGRGDDQ